LLFGSNPLQHSSASYQSAVESLLNPQAMLLFPRLDEEKLRLFRETFGPSAFVCRYLHCVRANEGFDTPRKRDLHEAVHQRKFRCSSPSCVNYSTGFATRASMNRHNEKYHNNVEDIATSLSEKISVLMISSEKASRQPQDLRDLFRHNRSLAFLSRTDSPRPSTVARSQNFRPKPNGRQRTPSESQSSNDASVSQFSIDWTEPEQTVFPVLLAHFGTDWNGIASLISTKSPDMVREIIFNHVQSASSNGGDHVTKLKYRSRTFTKAE
jgi:hypothetical protein